MTTISTGVLAILICAAAAWAESQASRESLSGAAQEARTLIKDEAGSARVRLSKAAEPVDEDAGGEPALEGKEPLPNFHQVTPVMYRSGQPNREGLSRLKAMGVKAILNLRSDASADEAEEAARLGMVMETVSMSGLTTPTFEQIDRALAVIADPRRRPLLVHCRFGKDRTGFVIAAYRTVVEGVDVDEAVKEAKSRGCCVPWFRDLRKHLVEYRTRRILVK